jgi:hypothetical protein
MDAPDYLGMIDAHVREELGDYPGPALGATSAEALQADEAWLRERARLHQFGRSAVIPHPIPLCW